MITFRTHNKEMGNYINRLYSNLEVVVGSLGVCVFMGLEMPENNLNDLSSLLLRDEIKPNLITERIRVNTCR